MIVRDKHKFSNRKRKNSKNEKIQLPIKQTTEAFHFVGAGNQECDEEREERKEIRLDTSEVLSVQPWQEPPYRGVRAEHSAKAVHTFRSKFFQIRTPSSLTAVSAEITDIQVKQLVGLRYNNKLQ